MQPMLFPLRNTFIIERNVGVSRVDLALLRCVSQSVQVAHWMYVLSSQRTYGLYSQYCARQHTLVTGVELNARGKIVALGLVLSQSTTQH